MTGGNRSGQILCLSLSQACRDQQVLEKKALQGREAAVAREADARMEGERQRAVLAAEVLHPSDECGLKRRSGTSDSVAACTPSGTSVHPLTVLLLHPPDT